MTIPARLIGLSGDWRSARQSFLRVGLLAGFLTMNGCILFMLGRKPATYDYVLKMGDASTISKWGLRQTRGRAILDAFGALSEIAALDRQDSPEAVRGAIAIYEKLRGGWPGFAGYNADDMPPVAGSEASIAPLELTLRQCYSYAGGIAGGRYSQELYVQIEPPVSEGERHEYWYKAGHDPAGRRIKRK